MDPITQQLDSDFVEFLDYFCNETEKGQFDKVLSSDLSQDLNIFFHGLPTIRAFRDTGIKKAWNLIVGVWDKTLLSNVQHIDITDASRSSIPATHDTKLFLKFESMFFDNYLNPDPRNIGFAKKINLEIVPVWPYTVGGWLRTQTPELAIYSYPDHLDSLKYEMKRVVLLLDVIVQLYVNNMRGIGDNKFLERNSAKLITLQSILQYLSNYLTIEHNYFYNPNSIMFPFDDTEHENNIMNTKRSVFSRLGALIACSDVNGGISKESTKEFELETNTKACLLSGVMYNLIDGFVREMEDSQYFILFLNNIGVFKQVTVDKDGKELKTAKIQFDFEKLLNGNEWKKWEGEFFNDKKDKFEEMKSIIQDYYEFKFGNIESHLRDSDGSTRKKLKRKRKKEERSIMDELFSLVRNLAKYAIVARPGEDSYLLEK